MSNHPRETTKHVLQQGDNTLLQGDQRVAKHFAERIHVSRDTNREFQDQRTFGQKVADRVATFGGSWTFIFLFMAVLLSWVVLNSFILARRGDAFDP